MLAAGVVKMLPGRKNLNGLRTRSTCQFQQSRMQPLIQKRVSGEDAQHFQQVPRIGPAFAPVPLLFLLSHFCSSTNCGPVLRSLVHAVRDIGCERARGLNGSQKNSISGVALKGTDFSSTANGAALKGTGFSPYANASRMSGALALRERNFQIPTHCRLFRTL